MRLQFLLFVLSLSWIATAQDASPGGPSVPTPPTAGPVEENVAIGGPYKWTSPRYPKNAFRNKVQGAVVLRLQLDEKGHVTGATVLSGNPELADAAVRAVPKWRYTPYYRDGKPVSVATNVTVNFRITDSGVPEITATYPKPSLSPPREVFRVGGKVTPPKTRYRVDPEYSQQARQTGRQGVCVLSLIVGPDGRPYDIRVSRALGDGLDEKAIEAVNKWIFVPAMKDGQPVAVAVNVEVQFRLR